VALVYKTGGRKRGTRNRASRDVRERLEALRCDPIAGMAALAMDGANAPELRGRMFAELAAYCFPRLRAVEFRAEFKPPLRVHEEPVTLEEAARQYREMCQLVSGCDR
jgi:hypothetical protein